MPSPLFALIRAEIAARGPLPFRDFMDLALYHPEFGYYASGRARIGRKGDFFTNVSVGPLFGRLLARAFAREWERLGRPPEFCIVEQGAHGGEFAADALGGLRECAPDCFAATRYRIVEPSPALAKRQQEHLAGLPVTWSDFLETLAPFAGVHFSNELPDAFPVHVVRWTGREWLQRSVTCDGESLVFCDAPLQVGLLQEACRRIPLPLPEGYTTEINLAASQWMRNVAGKLERGSMILVDYGYPREEYYAPERMEGTLSAYRQHRREADPLARPGEVDLTAHVDFTSLMEAGEAAGMKVAEFTDQHHFAVRLGMEHFADGANAHERRAFMTLMHPQFMGRAFKVLRMER